MVMIILGVLSAVAIPRYLDTIENAEEASAEDAVISNIGVALRTMQFTNSLIVVEGYGQTILLML